MDITRRQITKIAREVSKFTVRTLKADGIGIAEFDFIHTVRKNPGITQAGVRKILSLDKGAAARRSTALEAKGYLIRKPSPEDKRSQLLYATPKADQLKNSKASVEAKFYEWLLDGQQEKDRQAFSRILNMLYEKSKAESSAGFPYVSRLADSGESD
jgi:DNA-binding MarR family transcriptional regulator